MKRFFKSFRYGEKGFTLIELLVVVAILGVLAAVAVPNVGKFIGKGKEEAQKTEMANVVTALMAAMADANSGNVSGGNDAGTANFGDTDQDGNVTTAGVDVTVLGAYDVGDYLAGGADAVAGSYNIDTNGNVTQLDFP